VPRDDRDPTQPILLRLNGNELFHRTVFAIGLNGIAISTILMETLEAIGSSPDVVTIDELGAMMVEIERRLRLLLPHDDAGKAIARLRNLIMRWEG
jgi:hypothetical protein